MVNRNLENSNPLYAVVLLISITVLVMTVNATVITEVKILSASDKANGDGLGSSVAVSGDTVVLGAPYANSGGILRGQAYVFLKDQGGPDNWGQVKILSASDKANYDSFGSSVAVSGDTVVVGANYADSGGMDRGQAYVFSKDQGGSNNWGQVKILSASDKANDDVFGLQSRFRVILQLSGHIRADSGGTDRGQAYVFQNTSITVTDPDGGEGYAVNHGYGIQWQYTGNPGQTVKIELLKGSVLNTVLTPSESIGTDGLGYYYWLVSPTQPIGDDYSIRISSTQDPAVNDTSDAPFSVNPYSGVLLQIPDGGETWQQGTLHTIHWDHYSSWGATTAEIYLLKADQVVSTVTTTAPIGNNHSGTYCWTVPQSQVPGTDYKIRVVTIPGGDHDESNATFTIAAGGPPLAASTRIGVYKDGAWYLDNEGSGTWNAGDNAYSFGAPGWTSITGDWNATGKSYIGVTNGQAVVSGLERERSL